LHGAQTGELGRVIEAAHDLSTGGLAQALVEMAGNNSIGGAIDLRPLCDRDGIDSFTALFSESQARVLLEVPEHLLDVVYAAAEAEAIQAVRIGTTGGELLTISPAEPAGWSGSDTILFDVAEFATQSDQVLRSIFD
ncbi:MAG: AIR synthase-related protein, partial [Ancrocorticia sp.]